VNTPLWAQTMSLKYNQSLAGNDPKSELQQSGTWLAAASPPRGLRYRPVVFFRHLRLGALSFQQGKTRCVSKMLLLFFFTFFHIALSLKLCESSGNARPCTEPVLCSANHRKLLSQFYVVHTSGHYPEPVLNNTAAPFPEPILYSAHRSTAFGAR